MSYFMYLFEDNEKLILLQTLFSIILCYIFIKKYFLNLHFYIIINIYLVAVRFLSYL